MEMMTPTRMHEWNTGMTVAAIACHATVQAGAAKSQFPLKAVVFKSGYLSRMNSPPSNHSGVVVREMGGVTHLIASPEGGGRQVY